MSTVVRRTLGLIGVRKPFYELSLRLRVGLSQLPLVMTVALVTVLVACFFPETLRHPSFLIGLGQLAVLTLLAFAVPWDKTPRGSYWVIPLADFIAIGALRHSGQDAITGLGLLMLFPVFWLAWSGIAPVAARIISFVLPLAIVWLSAFLSAGPVTLQDLASTLIIPVLMLAFGVTISVASESETARQLAFEAKDRELQQVLRETRDRQRLLETMMDTVSVGLVAVDRGGHDILMNRHQRHNHLLAAPSGNRDPNESQLLIFQPDGTTPIPLEERPVLRAIRGETFNDELLWIGEGKQQRAMAVTARPMTDDDGKFDGSVIAFSDVTELVRALAAKDDFVASVSHELRTPLTSIIGYLDLALEEAEETDEAGQLAGSLRVAQRNAERLFQLVSDLLSSASGPMSIAPKRTSLAEVIRSSLDSAAPKAAAAGVVLRDDCPETLLAFIDPDRIGQVVDNLLSNAIKYSPGGGEVEVRAWTAGGHAVLEVRDNGLGISEEDQREVFTKFFRTAAVRRTAIPGVGLGLVISKSIVEAHGGTIECKSTLGAGTTFTVTLPLDEAQDGERRQAPAGVR
ncbi:sensor histidine kinase [Arthrobacter mangrovi]|uniref:histidine kinase n=1 Tax=Arthrobacter mangrovi TaxID=2966350 RepID=A0ABQ5MW03_9MICC|nr:cell wall metabolism sensor histidine kinase WalK [Arthrobacter mangrovi]GLB68166.1 two-component sensor histidine kinase [Arthrobacter mangrovi]